MQQGNPLGIGQTLSANATAGSLQRWVSKRLHSAEPMRHLLRETRPHVLNEDVGILSFPRHAHPHRRPTGTVANRAVNQVGQRPFNQLKVSIHFEVAWRCPPRGTGGLAWPTSNF